MAFSKSVQKGQVPKACDVCEVDTKINWKCFNCNLLMCTKCKDKIHPKFQSTEEHNVINIKEVGTHHRELNFSNIKCKIHAKQTCCMFCKTCDSIVCPQCISKVHNGHGLAEISQGYEMKVAKLKEVQKQVKMNTDELTDEKTKMNDMLKSRNSKYDDMKSKLLLQEKNLKETVHDLTSKLVKELDDEWKLVQFSVKKGKSKVDSLTERLNDQNNKVEELICSDDPKILLNKNNEEFTQHLEEIMTREIPDFRPFPDDFVPGVVASKNIGSFHREIQVHVFAQYATNLPRISHLSVCPDGSVWISDGNVVLKMRSDEMNVMKQLLRMTIKNEDMAVTLNGDLLLSIYREFALEQLDNKTGEITKSEFNFIPYIPTAICETGHHRVIVGGLSIKYKALFDDPFSPFGDRTVILIDMKTKNETTLKYGGNNERLFTFISDICTTKCGDVCVVDHLSSERTGRVLVLSPEDRNVPINIYNGHPDMNDGMKPFKPSSIVSTPMDNIIVSEAEHNAFHVLSCFGNLVKYIDTKEIGLVQPSSLGFTKLGRLYVGCAGHEEAPNNAKLFELDISGC